MSAFRQRLRERRHILFDGAIGTMLQQAGMPTGAVPEQFCLEEPHLLRGIHEAYIAAGADMVTTCTFGGNPWKLAAAMPGADVADTNRRLALVAREAADRAGRREEELMKGLDN